MTLRDLCMTFHGYELQNCCSSVAACTCSCTHDVDPIRLHLQNLRNLHLCSLGLCSCLGLGLSFCRLQQTQRTRCVVVTTSDNLVAFLDCSCKLVLCSLRVRKQGRQKLLMLHECSTVGINGRTDAFSPCCALQIVRHSCSFCDIFAEAHQIAIRLCTCSRLNIGL